MYFFLIMSDNCELEFAVIYYESMDGTRWLALQRRKPLFSIRMKTGTSPLQLGWRAYVILAHGSCILNRLFRVANGNYGDDKSLKDGVYELRFTFGPGYRVYFGEDGPYLVVLLCGGDKSSQEKDIETAKAYWEAYLSHG